MTGTQLDIFQQINRYHAGIECHLTSLQRMCLDHYIQSSEAKLWDVWTDIDCNDGRLLMDRNTNKTHFPTLPNQSHLNQLISSLVETPKLDIYGSDKKDFQDVQCWFGSWNRNTNKTHFPTLPNQSHLNQLISSLAETPKLDIYGSDKKDFQDVQCWFGS